MLELKRKPTSLCCGPGCCCCSCCCRRRKERHTVEDCRCAQPCQDPTADGSLLGMSALTDSLTLKLCKYAQQILSSKDAFPVFSLLQ